MEHCITGCADAPAVQASENDRVSDIEKQGMTDFDPIRIQSLGLPKGSREAIQNKPATAVFRCQSVFDDCDDNAIWNNSGDKLYLYKPDGTLYRRWNLN